MLSAKKSCVRNTIFYFLQFTLISPLKLHSPGIIRLRSFDFAAEYLDGEIEGLFFFSLFFFRVYISDSKSLTIIS